MGPDDNEHPPLRLIIARSDAARAQILEHLGGSNREQAEAAPLITVVCAEQLS